MVCLTINLLLLIGSFKILLFNNPFDTNQIENHLITTAEQQNIPISSEDIHRLVSASFDTQEILNTAFFIGIHNIIISSLVLLVILLIGVLYFIHHEICKPIEKLSRAIEDLNDKNTFSPIDHHKNEIKSLTNNFFLMAKQIEANKRKKNELISYITHDIRTPLTSISGYTQRLIEPGIADPLKRGRYYQTILSKANDIKVMLAELDGYITEEIQGIVLERVPINHFLNHLLSEYEEELLCYEIYLRKNISLPSSLIWRLDKKSMNRVFSNIFSNAVSHGRKGMTITFSAYALNDILHIHIENNGNELNQDQYDKVFELMYQGDASRTSDKPQGKGLGLTIVHQIVAKHNGTVHAYKPSSGGFGISIHLPYLN